MAGASRGRSHWGIRLGTALAVLGLLPALANAQSKPEAGDEIAVVQRKPVLRKGRVEFAPEFGLTINDSLIQQFELGAKLNYHATEFLWFGGEFGWFDLGELGGVTDEYFDVLDKTSSAPEVVELKWYGGARVGLVPIYGKFAIFDSAIVYYDLSVTLGGGYLTHVTGIGEETGAGAGEIGAQFRIFMNKWLALTASINDRIAPVELQTGSSVAQFVTVNFGTSFFLPFGFEYSTAR
jgi:outer membrane beta-barrel protein